MATKKELLIEIGTEEVPAAFLPAALSSMKALLEKELAAARIDSGPLETLGTPRRMVCMAAGVAADQKPLVTRRTGPAHAIAFDSDGNPTKAAVGFARGQGVDVRQLQKVETDKGAYVCVEKKESGRSTADLLPDIIGRVIRSIALPKTMRWSDVEFRFARPIHWITVLFDGGVIPLEVAGVRAGDTTFGHRFMAPGPISVSDTASYVQLLRAAHVMVHPDERRNHIRECVAAFAGQAGGVPDEDEALLTEVAWLVEYPFPVLCSFSKEFMDLPREVLLTTMKKHQRYFPILDHDGAPLARFVAVNNTDPSDPQVVIRGHERVLHARLADARFFYAEDLKKTLPAMAEALRHVVFQSKLGTSFEKVERFRRLAASITEAHINPDLKPLVDRTACLCKADLVSEMVGEFPELQGVMGREYARAGGEPDEVARAIFEHYLPRFADDSLPATDVGAVVSIADKLDTIVGCYAIGLVPSGTADPYALRRQCLGIINIILDRQYTIPLSEAVREAVSLLGDKAVRPPGDIKEDVLGFFSGRLAGLLAARGHTSDVIQSVISLGIDDLTDTVRRITALQKMKRDPSFEALAVSFKRVVNILAGTEAGRVDPDVFAQQEERNLYETYMDIRDRVKECMAGRDYREALTVIASIREAVDAFFDEVLVMAEDERLKNNRLALLYAIHTLFVDFADFSKIAAD